MSKKKVYFFIGDLRGGGAERALVEIINRINLPSIEVKLIVIEFEGKYISRLNDNIEVIQLLDKKPISGKIHIVRRIVKILKAEKPSLIISFTSPVNRFLLFAKILSGIINVKCCIVEQNNLTANLNTSYKGLARKFMIYFTKSLYAKTDYAIGVSQGVTDDLIAHYGIEPDTAHTIYNPVDIEHVKQRADENIESKQDTSSPLLIAIGRLIPQKGYHDMIEAIRMVNQEIPCYLYILGEGHLKKELQQQISDSNLIDKVKLLGFKENPWKYIKQADLFISTSYWEGFSLAHIEAIACKTPLLLTDCNFGPRELMKICSAGVLVPVGDVRAISSQILTILRSHNLQKALIMNGQECLSQFDSLNVAHSYEYFINKTINTQR